MTIRILQVVSVMDRGGAETMIMNYYRHMDRTKVQFDFLVHYEKRGIYEDEIERLGGRVYRAFPIRPWNYGKYRRWLDEFFCVHKEFVGVHAHILENCGFVLQAAEKSGIPIRIAHSHLAAPGLDYKYIFRQYGRYVLNKTKGIQCLACGKEAGDYLFPNREFHILSNAIDCKDFAYNTQIRDEMRNVLNLEGKIVVGNVARFHPVKNQSYLVDIFERLHQRQPNSVLLLIGDGEELEAVKRKVSDKSLETCIHFLGVREDVNQLLQAIDVFVFPSKLEGLPVSLIEAQAAGLPCVLSDRVSEETAITDLVQFVSLDESADSWTEKIIEVSKRERKDVSEMIIQAHYDIEENARWLQRLYLGE